jgi:redox-sensitive bicupin YhaK (pirin superfamily)
MAGMTPPSGVRWRIIARRTARGAHSGRLPESSGRRYHRRILRPAVPVPLLLAPKVRDLGGFAVRRVLPAFARRTVGPFIFFDHMGPAELPPGEGFDVRPHPHIGLATVTWLYEGDLVHRDSLGSVQTIAPGAVNWMTAGAGIVHSERSSDAARHRGVRLHGLQTWVALPRDHEEAAPAFVHVPREALPVLEPDGARIVVVAGDFLGARAPTPVFSRTLYASIELAAGARLAIPPEHQERAVYVVDGDVTLDDVPLPPAHMAVLEGHGTAVVRATSPARVMLVGGDALDGERFIWWNFVSSSKARIERAKGDWAAGRFAAVPGDTEFIPLPEG